MTDSSTSSAAPGTAVVLGWELRRLAAQRRSWLGIATAFAGPLVFVAAMSLANTALPKDTPFGRYTRDTGLAGPLVLLGFGGMWFLPLLTAMVTGDIFSAEDHHGTWKTYLTRSVSRNRVFLAKMIAGEV